MHFLTVKRGGKLELRLLTNRVQTFAGQVLVHLTNHLQKNAKQKVPEKKMTEVLRAAGVTVIIDVQL